MKIDDQILDFTQVNTLTDLGFDVEKHSSMCFLLHGSDVSISTLTKDKSHFTGYDHIATMTTADIIDVLPSKITDSYGDDYFIQIDKIDVRYVRWLYGSVEHAEEFEGEKLIVNLFDALVWCIKNKYINI